MRYRFARPVSCMLFQPSQSIENSAFPCVGISSKGYCKLCIRGVFSQLFKLAGCIEFADLAG